MFNLLLSSKMIDPRSFIRKKYMKMSTYKNILLTRYKHSFNTHSVFNLRQCVDCQHRRHVSMDRVVMDTGVGVTSTDMRTTVGIEGFRFQVDTGEM